MPGVRGRARVYRVGYDGGASFRELRTWGDTSDAARRVRDHLPSFAEVEL